MEATERSNKKYEEELKEKATVKLIESAVRKANAISAYKLYVDAKNKAVPNKETKLPEKDSVVVLKFLFLLLLA